MNKVCVIGHFAFGKELLNGQTIKTKTITKELQKKLGNHNVWTIDTHGGKKKFLQLITQTGNVAKKCKNIIMLPAYNGVFFLTPLLCIWKKIYNVKIHYIVIGGWLPEYLQNKKVLQRGLKKFDGIYVETNIMKKKLQEMGFKNIHIMPNCKDLQILKEDELIYSFDAPFKLCTFSRILKEKGIEEAVNAVKYVNEKLGRNYYILDIYGEIDERQKEWFEELKENFPDYVTYAGAVPFDKSVEVLKTYYALLFPTYYEGEGFAGTLLDAMAAGVPVVASDWKYNNEIVVPGKTGILVEAKNQNDLNRTLDIITDISWNQLKLECINEAYKYKSDKVVEILLKNL